MSLFLDSNDKNVYSYKNLSETANAMRPQVISNNDNHRSPNCLSNFQYNSKFLSVLEITQKRGENLLLPKKRPLYKAWPTA